MYPVESPAVDIGVARPPTVTIRRGAVIGNETESIVYPRPDSHMHTTMRSSLLPSVSASLLALTALSVPASAQSRDGWTYTTITIDSSNAGSRISRRVRYRMAGTAYRTDDLPMSGSAADTVEGAYETRRLRGGTRSPPSRWTRRQRA